MAMNPNAQGKTYGPFKYKAGLEKMKEFARAILEDDPHYLDEESAAKSRHEGVIAPPTFCVNFNMQPYVECVLDPQVEIDLFRFVHGEQTYEFHQPVKDGMVLVTTGQIEKIWEKDGKEFIVVRSESRLENGEPVVTGWYLGLMR